MAIKLLGLQNTFNEMNRLLNNNKLVRLDINLNLGEIEDYVYDFNPEFVSMSHWLHFHRK